MAEVDPSVGQRLKAEREKRGVTLADVAASTKMSKAALLAIERDDIKHLPGGIFARAFVRSYAKALGLDPDITCRQFMAQFPVTDVEPVEEHTTPSRRTIPPGARAFVHFGLASMPLGVAVIWFALSPGKPLDEALTGDRVAAATADIQAPAVLRPAAVVSPTRPEAVPASRQGGVLSLVLTMRSACWVSAATDGHPIVERLLNTGEVVELTAERMVAFKIGDASAVSLQINGETARSLGGPGQVVTARIDRTNFREFLAVP
jgi:cytoskeleton protein RodZ